ncbi:RNA-binding protein [Sulfitobacter pseudonitzschiae]|uniref:RNA-binding protein n=1 Tax=Pseudosulfitobacter pseudonitzschiae TaxID=1402135 RepID=A0A9Q2NED9_9RHOB|nr:RNA-binding protein [Pseudosulfitobacter pseudonitzschiae]MBM2295632.1 RNA-binding protein [Pseudosulfitobacter pseudonitzschiae]MBM2300544.1 RNA-binding protein [Pseudosulfitobacter pseudonitzschiae]MBM2310329.1 RNA-binding protein [Pseudosulfitobacter pseudonitzschiae]MBM2315241.1 RNA-binding protein [Pseudosulfitobacter pseudonitzschiae]|tara:strand:- start:726 stop:1322 length:597 start_codon:yes stop_codon:yes gene_type:complete
MARGGATKDREDGPERKCIATGEVQPKYGLVRFVVGPDMQIVPDIAGKLPGRGIYVAADRDAIQKAVTKKLFSRGAKMQVTVQEDLVDEVERQLARRVVDLIALSRKSGRAVAGYEKVKTWLQTEEAEVLIQAVDGSARGKTKLSTPHYGSYIGWLSADELGLAFGRQTVIHGALASGGLTQRVVEEARRLKGLRPNA